MAQCVVITGAASGIGKATAEWFVDQRFTVFGIDRDQAALDGCNFIMTKICADIGTEAGCKTIKAAIGDTAVHFLIYNAAFLPVIDEKKPNGAPLMKMSREQWNDLNNTVLSAPIFLTQALKDNLAAAKSDDFTARVVLISFIFAELFKPIPGWGAIGATKLATKYLQAVMNVECGSIFKTAYVMPGMTNTPLLNWVASTWTEHPLAKMAAGRLASGDCHTPEETALWIAEILNTTSDEDFTSKAWFIDNPAFHLSVGDQITQTSEIKAAFAEMQKQTEMKKEVSTDVPQSDAIAQ